MATIYQDKDSKFFYLVERYTVDQKDWVRYTNAVGEEFTCFEEAFLERFTPQEQ